MDFFSNAALWLSLIFIALFFGFGALFGWQHKNRYERMETRQLNVVKDRLSAKTAELRSPPEEVDDEEITEIQANETLHRLISIDDLIEDIAQKSIIYDRLALIKRMRESYAKVNLNALQQMTLGREAKKSGLHFPGLAANLSMLIGLLGTIVGLFLMVEHIDLGLPEETGTATLDSWMVSVGHIRGVLSGMSVGFSSTMAGLLSTIILVWLNHGLAHAQSAFLDDLDRFTVQELLPATVPATEDETLLERVSLRLEEGFDQLERMTQDNQNIITELNSIQDGFLEIINNIRASTKTETSERLLELIGRFTSVNQAVVNYTDSLPTFSQDIKAVYKDNAVRTDKLIRHYEEQRSQFHWPFHIKAVFVFMAILNFALLGVVLYK